MDRRVKERLVGASILVVLIVLIVPALLSGPAQTPAPSAAAPGLPVTMSTPEPIRNVTVDLTTSKPPAPEPAADTAVAAAASAVPAASAAPTASAASAPPTASSAQPQARNDDPPSAVSGTAVASTSLETLPAPPTSSVSAGKSATAGRGWTVQLGSFASHDNADKLQRQLRAQGVAAFVSPSGAGSSLRYRVRIGPMADRGAAAQAVVKLKGLGHASSVIAPGL
jgi:DedD protein